MSTFGSITIYRYSSHLEFLQDAYDSYHAQDPSFSYDKIAGLCGLKSRTEARNIIKGVKKASDSALWNLGGCFGLDNDGKNYLLCLARFYEAGGSPAAYGLFQKLITIQKEKLPAINPFREIEIATSVLHMTLLSALELENTPQDAVAISTLLKGKYSSKEIEVALGELQNSGFIAWDAPHSKWIPKQKHIRKYDYNSNFFLRRFHSQSLELAKEALENDQQKERYLVGASFCINGKVFPRIIQKMNAFIENLMQLDGMAGVPDTVVQLNQQLVKMTVTDQTNNERGLSRGDAVERGFDSMQNPVIA